MIARAVIIQNNKNLLLIHRYKNGKAYYVLPGGHQQPGETSEQTLLREIKEETNLDIAIDKKLWSINHSETGEATHIFLVTRFSGSLRLGSPERERSHPENRFLLEWHPLDSLSHLALVPPSIKDRLLKHFCADIS